MLAALILFAVLLPNIELGENLTPPAQVAGPWEGLVGPGEVAGFSLQVITNADEKVRLLRLDTYVRKEGKTTRTWWSIGNAGEFVMRTGHFHFHQARGSNERFDVTLDLTYDPSDMAWKGSFANPFFAGPVALRRPNVNNPSAPTGTWRTYSHVSISPTERADEYGCLNIGVAQDDALVLWAEYHHLFLGYDSGNRPLYGDSFGILYDDSHAVRDGDEWSFTAGTSMAGDRITGRLSSDGASFGGYRTHYGNGYSDPSHPRYVLAWTRMLNLACRA